MSASPSAAPAADAQPALSALAAGAGCGCKLPAAELLPLLEGLRPRADERLLVGASTSDDAAVFQLREDLALVQTIDFFTAPVDDPGDFGRIAACNALSDIYAMGATPVLALNVLAVPLRRLGGEALRAILRGGLEVVERAGAVLAGGHSIEDPEPKYGLAVSGVADPRRIVTNAGGRPGDVLVLSKPLGVGAVLAARQRGSGSPRQLAQAVATMTELNREAAAAALRAGVHAMTDVTGFGLLGHLHHMCRESGFAAEVDAASVPALDGVEELLSSGLGSSGGSRRNASWVAPFVRFDGVVERWRRALLVDATTSGGLLAAVPAAHAGEAVGVPIGRLREGPAGFVHVR